MRSVSTYTDRLRTTRLQRASKCKSSLFLLRAPAALSPRVRDGLTGCRLRKIDRWILPAFCMTQGLAYLDKTSLNYGNLFGMKQSLHVTTEQFVSLGLVAVDLDFGRIHT